MPECAAITPDSRLGELLERWPGLEDLLLELSPHFRALKNPVLRRTIAKVATLRQVASVSGVPLGVLVEKLRAGAGLSPLSADAHGSLSPAGGEGQGEGAPPWASTASTTRRHDARAAIEAGEHPMPKVMADLAALGADEVYELVTPFVPAPLVDLARGKGFASFSARDGEGVVRTWFRRG